MHAAFVLLNWRFAKRASDGYMQSRSGGTQHISLLIRVPVPSALAWTVPLGARFRVNDNPLRPFHLLELLADFLPFPLLCQIRRSKRNKFRFCFFVNTCSQVTGMCSAVRHFQQNRKPHRHSTTHFAPTGSKITESAKRTHASTNPDIEI